MELEAILVVHQENLATHEVQERVPEAVDLADQKELHDHQRKYKLAEMDHLFYLLLRSQVSQLGLTSQTFYPEYNYCPRARIKCGTEKIELGYRTSSGFTAGSKDVKIASHNALDNHAALELHIWLKRTSTD